MSNENSMTRGRARLTCDAVAAARAQLRYDRHRAFTACGGCCPPRSAPALSANASLTFCASAIIRSTVLLDAMKQVAEEPVAERVVADVPITEPPHARA
jgi:hypothetical protein